MAKALVEVVGLRPGTGFRARDVSIYRPYRDEIPWELLSTSADLAPTVVDDGFMRVAKYLGEVVGVYVISPQSALSYRLHTLVVAEAFRRRGVGRWLLGHAIGIAESKGGREMTLDGLPARGYFVAQGFEPKAGNLTLTFTPE